jgi:hypothetical protein
MSDESTYADEQSTPHADLDRFERGELTEAEFFDRRVKTGMAHVHGRISAECFEMVW